MCFNYKLYWFNQLHILATYDLILKLQVKNINSLFTYKYVNMFVHNPGSNYIYIVRFVEALTFGSFKFNFYSYKKKLLQPGQKKIKKITNISLFKEDVFNFKTSLLLSFFLFYFNFKSNAFKVRSTVSENNAYFKSTYLDSFTLAKMLNIVGDRDWNINFKFIYVSKFMFYYAAMFKLVDKRI